METLAADLASYRAASPGWEPIYDRFVAKLRDCDVGVGAPAIGDRIPDFTLPDASGRHLRLSGLLAGGPLVLSFQRGGWCPFCRRELAAWALRLPALRSRGASFAAVIGEVGGRAGKAARHAGLDAPVLVDVDHGLALELGLAFPIVGDLKARYLENGLDLGAVYGGSSWFVPIPATFVVDRDRTVRFAFADPDFRLRAEPDDVLAALPAA